MKSRGRGIRLRAHFQQERPVSTHGRNNVVCQRHEQEKTSFGREALLSNIQWFFKKLENEELIITSRQAFPQTNKLMPLIFLGALSAHV